MIKSKRLLGLLVATVTLSTLSISTFAQTFVVSAKANAATGGLPLPTGIMVTEGELLTVTTNAEDLWSAGKLPRWSNADGLVGDTFATGSDESGQAAGTLIGKNFGIYTKNDFKAPFGALVGQIGSTYVLFGTSYSAAAPATGLLSLYNWDSYGPDNANSILVSVSAVPEPSTMSALFSGLIALALIVRRKQRKLSTSLFGKLY